MRPPYGLCSTGRGVRLESKNPKKDKESRRKKRKAKKAKKEPQAKAGPHKLTKAHKDALIQDTRRIVNTVWSDGGSASCAYSAMTLIELARRRHGIRLVLQAGDALWRRMSPAQDDGVSPTHFGYEWEPESPASIRAMIEGRMPEMHVWLGDPVQQELIDPTSGFFPAQCESLIGESWLDKRPPSYLWCSPQDLPDEAIYRANAPATITAGRIIQTRMKELLDYLDRGSNPPRAHLGVVAYHGSDVPIRRFDRDKAAMGVFWFSEDKGAVERGEKANRTDWLITAHLNVGSKIAGWDEYDKLGLYELERQFDSVHLDDDWIVFDPSKIKVLKVEKIDRGSRRNPEEWDQHLRRFVPSSSPLRGDRLEQWLERRVHSGDLDAVRRLIRSYARSRKPKRIYDLMSYLPPNELKWAGNLYWVARGINDPHWWYVIPQSWTGADSFAVYAVTSEEAVQKAIEHGAHKSSHAMWLSPDSLKHFPPENVIQGNPPRARSALKRVRKAVGRDQECYPAAEVVYHAGGGRRAGLTPVQQRHEGVSHWWVRGPEGEVLDPASAQFRRPVPYQRGRGRGFLTKRPSQRARELAKRASVRLNPGMVHHYEDYAEDCQGPEGWVTGARELVTCETCQNRFRQEHPDQHGVACKCQDAYLNLHNWWDCPVHGVYRLRRPNPHLHGTPGSIYY